MAKKRTWYSKYIDYQFADGAILKDVFYFTDENGKAAGTGYEVYYPDTDTWTVMSYRAFKQIVDRTDLPR